MLLDHVFLEHFPEPDLHYRINWRKDQTTPLAVDCLVEVTTRFRALGMNYARSRDPRVKTSVGKPYLVNQPVQKREAARLDPVEDHCHGCSAHSMQPSYVGMHSRV